MKKLISILLLLCGLQANHSFACIGDISDELLCETPEVLFKTGEAVVLQEVAQDLGSVVNIYEYLRNNAKYAVYHGARSSSLNAFLGLEGNDVDLASALIAMYRSVGVKARYVTGDIRVKREGIANWIAVGNSKLAVSILQNQGINIVDDTDADYVVFEHVWVEALVNFADYRGASEGVQACVTETDQCKWIALDPSFKLRTHKPEHRDLLETLSFDYSAYYRAESDQQLRDKSPLEIFEENALGYLRTNHSGLTLEDVIDEGEIVEERLGLLPSSLPYEVVGSVQRFASVRKHDEVVGNDHDWQNFATVKIHLDWEHDVEGNGCDNVALRGATVSMSELSTKRLTVNWLRSDSSEALAIRLDGNVLARIDGGGSGDSFSCGGETIAILPGLRFRISLEIDGSQSQSPISLTHDNLVMGGYYLIATGGETSNWSQVRRAYRSLLTANEQYPIINNAFGDVYVDDNGNGLVDPGEGLLLHNQEAQDALTGGLLYTAQALYYTRLKEESRRYSRLKNIVSPIDAFAGVVSTTFEVELIHETPFAVLPGGLLIDLKGIRLNGSWRADEEETYSNETFKFLGHVASSLEHEVWQELTGYDAVSTMRGIQFALKDGATLMDIHNSSIGDTFEQSLQDMGVGHTPPSGFTRREHQLFGRTMVTWQYGGSESDAGFYVFNGDISSYPIGDYRAKRYLYEATNGVDAGIASYDATENQLLGGIATETQIQTYTYDLPGATGYTVVGTPTLSGPDASRFTFDSHSKPSNDIFRFLVKEASNNTPATYQVTVNFQVTDGSSLYSASSDFTISPMTTSITCNGQSFTEVLLSTALMEWENCFDALMAINPEPSDFFDRNKGFNPDAVFYVNSNESYYKTIQGLAKYNIDFVDDVRDHLYFAPSTARYSFIAPSRLAVGPFFAFEVFIKDTIDASNDNVVRSSYIIKNQSMRLRAGGGYVPEGVPVNPATDTEGVEVSGTSVDTSGVTFNNEVFTDQNLVAIANNDVVRTPSTVDPVSTVTGNMYHDETDFVVPGKGLPYAFTRTYNSNQTSTSGPGSSNVSHFPLSQGWTHSYNMKLVANDYGRFPNYDVSLAPENTNSSTSSITYVDERGGESNYLLDDQNASAQPTSPRAGFDMLRLNSPSSGLHTVTYNNGVKYIFDSRGEDMRTPGGVALLYRIEDAYGNQLSFGYTDDRLVTVKDNLNLAGRTGLTLGYYSSGENSGRLRYVSDWTGRQWEYFYTAGQLSSVVNPLGDAMAYTYVEDTHRLKDIIHPQDRNGKQKTMTFSYYENGQAYSYVDQNGSMESLIYDLFRRRTRVTNPRGLITEHYYDENGALIKLIEPDKGILLFENNDDGLRYTKYDAIGKRTRYSYHSSRSLDGAASDTNGQVTREQNTLGHTTDYDYGIHGQVTTVKDPNGNRFTNVYYTTNDPSIGAVIGKLRRKIAATATVNGVAHSNVTLAEYQYHPDGTLKKTIEYIDPAQPSRQRVTNHIYNYSSDGSYTLTSSVSGSGKTVTTEKVYDQLWRKQSSTTYRRTSAADATQIALTTSFEYDDLGRAVKTTDPIGNIAETIYDSNGKVSQSIERYRLQTSNNSPLHPECSIDATYPNHHTCVVTTNTYDAADRLLTTTNVKGATTRYKYDPMGNVVQVTNNLSNSLYYEYDAKGRRTKVTDEKGYTVKTEYDLAGRVLSITDANKNSIKYTYDALGRQKEVTSPQGRVTRYDNYDANGNVLRMTDPNGVAGTQPLNSQNASVYNVFDEFNRVVSSLNANNERTAYTFDLLGNRTSATDAKSQVTTFVYDDLSRLIRVIDPIIESGTDKVVSITYDEVGNRLTYTDRLGEVTRYDYDKLNRLVQESYLADGITANKVYDQYGDTVSTSYGANTYTYAYDVGHRLLSKTDTRSNLSMTWQYDSIGNLVRKTSYEGNLQQFTYDSSNRLVAMSVGDPLIIQASYHYDPAGRLLSRILSNGAATLYNYTTDGFLTSIKQVGADGYQIDLRQFEHDNIGNIKKVTLNGSEVVDYSYDPAYRLLSADSNINRHDFSYTYDAVGNRLTKTANDATQHYIIGNGNRLEEVRQNTVTGPLVYSFDYDANGSMTNKYNGSGHPLLDIDYDQRRLASVMAVNNQPDSLAFQYDANAYRIEKRSSTGTKKYYLEAEHLESVYDGNNELQASYLRGVVVDEIISGFERNANGEMENRTFHHDQVNSVVALTDHNGSAVQTLIYGPFGESLGVAGTSQNAMRYTGREQDSDSGLYYYRARYYDPELGRFISEDPIGFEGGINFYAYVGNNPIRFADPMGEDLSDVARAMADPDYWKGIGEDFMSGAARDNIFAALSAELSIAAGAAEWAIGVGLGGVTPPALFVEMHGTANISSGVGDYLDIVVGGEDRNWNFVQTGYKNISELATGTPAYGAALYGVAELGIGGYGIYDSLKHVPLDKIPMSQTLTTHPVGYQQRGLLDGTAVLGNDAVGMYQASDTIGGAFSDTTAGGSHGGFVLYPNKVNTNFTARVYSK